MAKKPRLASASAALTRVGEAIATGLHTDFRNERRWRYGTIAGMAAVLTILLAVLCWKMWYKASLPTRSASSPQGTVSESPDGAAGVGVVWQPGTARVSQPVSAPTASRSAPDTASPQATKPAPAKPLDTTMRRKLLVQGAPDRVQTTTVATDAPQMPTSDDGPTSLGSLLPASPALPKLTVPISQGVSGGALVHRVMPVYPLEARQLHVQGTVVLEATVNETGQIENLKVVSGSPLLAQSAMDAVRKWRYSPYLLNGKPIRKETQINITFIPE